MNDERLIRARDLIVTTDKKIKEIAEECGFKSQSYFISAFGYCFGKTPTELRKEKARNSNYSL